MVSIRLNIILFRLPVQKQILSNRISVITFLLERRYYSAHKRSKIRLPMSAMTLSTIIQFSFVSFSEGSSILTLYSSANKFSLVFVNGQAVREFSVLDYGLWLRNQGYTVFGRRTEGHQSMDTKQYEYVEYEENYRCIKKSILHSKCSLLS